MSQVTKKALAASLKKLLSQKPLTKITVVDITEDCGVNRQTFYYHFQDIYGLIEWIYASEGNRAIGDKRTYDTWEQGFLAIFQYALSNKSFVLNTYHSISREHLGRYLYEETFDLLTGVIEEKAKGMPVREEDKRFIADFYKYAFVGLALEWIRQGMKEEPDKIVNRLSTLISGDFERALEKFRTNHMR